MNTNLKYNVSAGMRYGMFFCACVLCFIIAAFVLALILRNGATPTKMCIATTMQDILMFILPAIITAIVITRRPGDFLMLVKGPGIVNMLLVFLTIIASVPAMNVIIQLNQNIELPESMSAIQQWMIESEQSASESIKLILGNGSINSLIVGLLVVGVMAGLSEELFFRGTLQQIIKSTPVNKHIAVWTTAIIFSAIHMQFFGFIPRMLLGAFFGYIAIWSGSIWLAVAAHAFNNAITFTSMWLLTRSNGEIDLDTKLTPELSLSDMPMIMLSIVLTTILITILYRRLKQTA